MRTPIFAGLAILAAAGLSACSEKTQDNLEQTGDQPGGSVICFRHREGRVAVVAGGIDVGSIFDQQTGHCRFSHECGAVECGGAVVVSGENIRSAVDECGSGFGLAKQCCPREGSEPGGVQLAGIGTLG